MGHRPGTRTGRGLIAALALALAAAAAGAADYSVLSQGTPAGRMAVVATEGKVEVDFSYRDNGRGPDIRETVRVAPRGQPLAYTSVGTSTFGATLDETLVLEAGRARWKSPSDQGEAAAGDDFVFLPLESTVAYQAMVARFVLQRPGSAAPTILGQTLRAERVQRFTAQGPAGPVPLVLVALTGAGPDPWLFWLRDDDSLAFFAFGWPGFAIIERGHEALADALIERARVAGDERRVALGQRLAIPLPGATLIEAVRWFDAPAAVMRGPSDVWLFNGRIGAVTPPGALRAKPDRRISGSGRTLLPGLWDMHAHLWSGDCLPNLAAGVTGARDAGNDNTSLLRLVQQVERGEMKCPTVVPMGFIEGKSPFSARNGIVADDLPAALDAVDWYAARGYRSVKLYNSIKPEWVKPMAARARAHGLRVAGHVPAFMLAGQAVKDGYDEITHINQAMLNFVTRPGDDPRTLMRFERVGSDAAKLSLGSPAAKAFLRLLRERGTTVDPTAVAFEAMFTQAQGQPNPSVAAIAEHLPVLWQRGLGSAEMDLSGPKLERFRQSYDKLLQLIGAMHRGGVMLVAGTDSWTGIGLHRELELYVKAGIPAPEVLRIATWNGARVAGEGATRGRIARGMAADLVLIEGDPSKDISAIRRASLVIRGNEAYRPAALYEALGFKPFVPGATWAE